MIAVNVIDEVFTGIAQDHGNAITRPAEYKSLSSNVPALCTACMTSRQHNCSHININSSACVCVCVNDCEMAVQILIEWMSRRLRGSKAVVIYYE